MADHKKKLIFSIDGEVAIEKNLNDSFAIRIAGEDLHFNVCENKNGNIELILDILGWYQRKKIKNGKRANIRAFINSYE